MSKGAINFSNDNEYYTPKSIVSRFGTFDYDPSTTAEKAAELGIKNFDTMETDGLFRDWTSFNRIWVNPPFTQKHLFLEKAVNTYLHSQNDIFFSLHLLLFCQQNAFMNKLKKWGGVKLFLFNGRINFESGLGKNLKSPAFGSVVFKLQKESEIVYLEL